ncbi:MAG: VOC family protein [Phycisphaerales bacterium]|nr:VOC family protein [Phycisphaerales bacterium]MCB9862508.1 VOC family protein [Phycisphaerales bacterium]
MDSMLQQVQPVLPSKDVPAAVRFYVEKLGFRPAFQDDPNLPRYAGIRRDGVELHLQWHDTAEWHRVERPMLRFYVSDVDQLHAEFAASGVCKPGRPYATAWGTYEFAFYDVDGNGLTFYQHPKCNHGPAGT